MKNLLNSRGYFKVSLSNNLASSLAAYSSYNSIFINSMISAIRESSVYKPIIAIISLLNSR